MSTEQFIRERKYLKAVSDATVAWYRISFRAFEGALDSTAAINARIIQLRDRGVKPVSINTWLRCIKAYYLWQGKTWEVAKLKEEQRVLSTFSTEDIRSLLTWKAVTAGDRRLKALFLTAIDTGMRIDELLRLTRESVNLDALTLLVMGKGNKQRLIPMSAELRKVLFRHTSSHDHVLIFCSKYGGKLSQRNVLRDFKNACRGLGITGVRTSFHTLRHTFAVNARRRTHARTVGLAGAFT